MAQATLWDVPGAVWDEVGTAWDVGARFDGALRGTGLLTGVLPTFGARLPHIFADDVLPGSLSVELDENFDALVTTLNTPGRIGIGALAARPAPGHPGALYVATDSNDEWWADDGLAWQPMGALGAGLLVWDPSTDSLRLFGAPGVGGGGGRVLAGGKATTRPTEALIDGAVLYVADVQGVAGRATWHHLSEAGHHLPLAGALFRDGLTLLQGPAEGSVFASGPPTLQAGTLVGRYLEVWWRGDLKNDSGSAQPFTLRLKLGGTEIVAVTLADIPTSPTPVPASVLIRLDGLTGAVQWGLPLAIQGPGTVSVVCTAGAADPTGAQPLDVTAAWALWAPHGPSLLAAPRDPVVTPMDIVASQEVRTYALQVRYR